MSSLFSPSLVDSSRCSAARIVLRLSRSGVPGLYLAFSKVPRQQLLDELTFAVAGGEFGVQLVDIMLSLLPSPSESVQSNPETLALSLDLFSHLQSLAPMWLQMTVSSPPPPSTNRYTDLLVGLSLSLRKVDTLIASVLDLCEATVKAQQDSGTRDPMTALRGATLLETSLRAAKTQASSYDKPTGKRTRTTTTTTTDKVDKAAETAKAAAAAKASTTATSGVAAGAGAAPDDKMDVEAEKDELGDTCSYKRSGQGFVSQHW